MPGRRKREDEVRVPRPAVCTALEHAGVGLVVYGRAMSVRLCLEDARRQRQGSVAMLSDAGLVDVDVTTPWEMREVRHG